jgi:hypothetical protein
MIALLCIEPYKVEKLGGLHADFKRNGLYFAESEDEYGHYHFRNMNFYAFSVDGSHFEKLAWDEARLALLLFDSGPKKA